MEKRIRVIAARLKFPHMGKHAGYDQLYKALENRSTITIYDFWRISERFFSHIINLSTLLFFRMLYGNHFFSSFDWLSNWQTARLAKKKNADIIHLSHLENSYSDPLNFLQKNKGIKIIGTIHQPVSWWKAKVRKMKALNQLDAIIVMSNTELAFFEKHAPQKVHLIKHGIDTGFFFPDAKVLKDYKSCVFSGNWMRNIPLLIKVINNTISKDPSIKFNVINPHFDKNNHPLHSLRKNKNVSLFKDLSDEELRDVYRKSAILLLPLLDSTVNNALMEGAACGLPVIASDVGGVRDYTSPSFCEYIPTEDPLKEVELFSEQILTILGNRGLLETKGKAASAYMQQNLSWEIIASKTENLYRKLLL